MNCYLALKPSYIGTNNGNIIKEVKSPSPDEALSPCNFIIPCCSLSRLKSASRCRLQCKVVLCGCVVVGGENFSVALQSIVGISPTQNRASLFIFCKNFINQRLNPRGVQLHVHSRAAACLALFCFCFQRDARSCLPGSVRNCCWFVSRAAFLQKLYLEF